MTEIQLIYTILLNLDVLLFLGIFILFDKVKDLRRDIMKLDELLLNEMERVDTLEQEVQYDGDTLL